MNRSTTIPSSIDHLTPEVVSEALKESGAIRSATLRSVSCRPIKERRGFVGETFRCTLDYDIQEESAPTSLIAKLARADPVQKRAFNEFGLYEREVLFYRHLRSATRLPIPDCYFAAHDPATGNFLLLLQDLAPAITGNRLEGSTATQARQALEAISTMHGGWWNNEGLENLCWLRSPNAPQTSVLVTSGYEEIWSSFERKAQGYLPNSIRALGRRLTSKLPDVLDRLSTPPRTLVHGDYQVGNIFFSPAGTIAGVIDWQVCVKGRGAMDVAHLLVRSLPPDDRRRAEFDLLRHYHTCLVRNGVSDYPFSECWEDYLYSIIAEFGLGIILAFVLTQVVDSGQRSSASELESLARVGLARLFAALVDMNWERLIGRKRLITLPRRTRRSLN